MAQGALRAAGDAVDAAPHRPRQARPLRRPRKIVIHPMENAMRFTGRLLAALLFGMSALLNGEEAAAALYVGARRVGGRFRCYLRAVCA